MKFFTISELNTKTNQYFVHYCQWDTNEEVFQTLRKIIFLCEYTSMPNDEYSMYAYDDKPLTEDQISEDFSPEVQEYNPTMFHKHLGKLQLPSFDGITDPTEAATTLNRLFHSCRVGEHFVSSPIECGQNQEVKNENLSKKEAPDAIES